MIREKSCGAVIYTTVDGVREYLVEQMLGGHYGLPKGHVEPGETEAETAIREIREETGLTVSLDTSFRDMITYSPFEGCKKDVVFFIARSYTKQTVPQLEEVRGLEWLTIENAVLAISHEQTREVLSKADAYLNRF